MKKMMLMLLLLSLIVVSGCQTMGGFGRDMQNAGKWLEETAK